MKKVLLFITWMHDSIELYFIYVLNVLMFHYYGVFKKYARDLFVRSQKQPLDVFHKKGVLKNFVKFIGKHLYQRLFFIKVSGLRPATLLKKRLWYWCFPMIFGKFSGATFLYNTCGRLLLKQCLCWCLCYPKQSDRSRRNKSGDTKSGS